MKIEGPAISPESFTVLCPKGTNKFSGIATLLLPKLYIASIDEKPVYVGVTKQAIRSRLRFGWKASGRGGYYGYAWRNENTAANLDVWCHMDAIDRNGKTSKQSKRRWFF